ncbi:MAG TPA: type II secretion system protein [Lysobacter sp.]
MARGFSLIELLVTLAIMATLATVALPLTQVAAQRSREDELRRALWQIRDAIDAYKEATDEGRIDKSVDDSGYPPTLDALVDGVADRGSATGARIYFLRRVPRDPTCDCPSRGDGQTWGLRSYASPPDSPGEGSDVYDVHSLSDGIALDGTAYRTW